MVISAFISSFAATLQGSTKVMVFAVLSTTPLTSPMVASFTVVSLLAGVATTSTV